MRFFEHQERAKDNTRWLVFYFALAVALLVLGTYIVLRGAYIYSITDSRHSFPMDLRDPIWWSRHWLVQTSIVISMVIIAGSYFKIKELSVGGSALALKLGAKLVIPNTHDLDEKKLLNVVDEMSIASGTRVPTIYVLSNEASINAFVAGKDANHATLVVTQGALRSLNRDELQGVIAHEFSHILNGDMALNFTLLGVLHGIQLIALAGYHLLDFALDRSSGPYRRRQVNAVLLVVGFLIMLIGYSGLVICRLIKLAVSRQRELLADASAVQFTRNPGGVAGALKKIGGQTQKTTLNRSDFEEINHMLFWSIFSTHPHLLQRIRLIEPSFDGKFTPTLKPEIPEVSEVKNAVPASTSEKVAPQQVNYAKEILSKIPTPLLTAVKEPLSARTLIFALLVQRESLLRERQLKLLQSKLDPISYAELHRFADLLVHLPQYVRQPLLDLSAPSLKLFSKMQLSELAAICNQLIATDDQIDPFEYVLYKLISIQLNPKKTLVKYYAIDPLLSQIVILLSGLAYLGSSSQLEAENAFRKAAERLGSKKSLVITTPGEYNLQNFDEALLRLGQASIAIKKRFLDAALACILADQKIHPDQASLFRAIAVVLDCPVPPLLSPAQAA